MSEEQSILIDKKTYSKLKKLADTNECTVNEEIEKAFTAAYEDLDDSVFDEIAIVEKRDSVSLVLPTDLYDSFQEEADKNETEIEAELKVFFEEHLNASDDGNEEESEDEEESTEEESESDESNEEEESQSILIDKEIYIKLKKLADTNECSINEEIGKAFTAAYEDMDDATLEKIDVMPRKDVVYVLLPKDLYDSFQEEANKNETEIEAELKVFFEEHLNASDDGNEEESEEEEVTEDSEDEEESSEEEESEDDDDDESRAKKPEKSKGLFNLITDTVGEFVEDLISGHEKADHKKKD